MACIVFKHRNVTPCNVEHEDKHALEDNFFFFFVFPFYNEFHSYEILFLCI